MKQNNKFLLGFVAIVIVPVVIVWYTAWPIIRAWQLPRVVSGHEIIPQERALQANEVQQLDQWIHTHQTGWGVSGERAAGRARRVVVLKADNGTDVIVSLWHFRHGDDVAGIQTSLHGPYRMRSCAAGEIQPLLQSVATP